MFRCECGNAYGIWEGRTAKNLLVRHGLVFVVARGFNIHIRFDEKGQEITTCGRGAVFALLLQRLFLVLDYLHSDTADAIMADRVSERCKIRTKLHLRFEIGIESPT